MGLWSNDVVKDVKVSVFFFMFYGFYVSFHSLGQAMFFKMGGNVESTLVLFVYKRVSAHGSTVCLHEYSRVSSVVKLRVFMHL